MADKLRGSFVSEGGRFHIAVPDTYDPATGRCEVYCGAGRPDRRIPVVRRASRAWPEEVCAACRADFRINPKFCRKCGYDLRATPGRCPECGTAAAADAAAG